MITGSEDRMANPRVGDVIIEDWEAANLLKPSLIRTRRVFSAEPADFERALGEVPRELLLAARSEIGRILVTDGAAQA